MSVPTVPHRFVDLSNLDMEKVNDNLEGIAADVNGNLGKRYTYSQLVFDLTGLVTASAEVLRQFAIRRPGANNGVEVVGVEAVLYGNVAGTATVTCSDSSWPVLSVTTSGTTTTECRGAQFIPVSVPSNSADVTFTVAFPAAYTVTNGYLVVHLRCDRGNQGDTYTTYTPTLIDSASSTAGSVLDTQLQAAETSVTCDTNADKDLRCECYTVRSLTAGNSVVFRAPSGARRILAITGYNVQASGAGNDCNFDVASVSGRFDTVSLTVNGAGATSRAVGTTAASGDVTDGDNPLDPTEDETITIDADTADVALGYVLVWWS